LEEKIIDLLDEKFKEAEFEDCFWLDVKRHSVRNKLEVIIDSDTGLTLKKCQRISRYLEGFIDEEGWLGEKYVIEVCSPGADKPLKIARQYPKHIGRKLEVKKKDGETEEGRLTEVTEKGILIEYKVRRKEGKRKVTEEVKSNIAFDQIEQAKVKLSFNKKK